MPTVISPPREFDPALMASSLPESLRKPGGIALQMLKDLFPTEPTDIPFAIGMPKTPSGRDVPNWVYKKLMSIKDPKIRGEIDRLGGEYDTLNKLRQQGQDVDPQHIKDLGKRLAELDRIGRTGKPFKPSTEELQRPMAPELGEYVKDSHIINEARYKAMHGLRRAKPAPKKTKK